MTIQPERLVLERMFDLGQHNPIELTDQSTGKGEDLGVMAENLIRPIGTLYAVVSGSGILPVGRGMDWSAVG